MPKEYFILVIKDGLNLLKTGFFLIVQQRGGKNPNVPRATLSALEMSTYAGYCSREPYLKKIYF